MPQEEIDNNAYNNRFTKIAPKRRKFVKRNVSDSGSENAKYIDVSTFTEDDLKTILIVLTPPLVWGRFK